MEPTHIIDMQSRHFSGASIPFERVKKRNLVHCSPIQMVLKEEI